VRDAWAALNQPAGPDLRSAEQYFGMALCIEPGHVEAAETLTAVREALAMVAARGGDHAGGAADTSAQDSEVHDEL